MPSQFWLFKSEPEAFSYADLEAAPAATTGWDGVRNYQARNFLRDLVAIGDGVLFYHSRQQPMAVVGCARVVRAAYPDPSQFDPGSRYHDPRATQERPIWCAVDIQATGSLPQPVTLSTLRDSPLAADMWLLRPGARLSITPVHQSHWHLVRQLGGLAA